MAEISWDKASGGALISMSCSHVLERSRFTSLHFTHNYKQKEMSDHKTIFAALPLHFASSTPPCPELSIQLPDAILEVVSLREWLSMMSLPTIQPSLIYISVTAPFSSGPWSPLQVLPTNGS